MTTKKETTTAKKVSPVKQPKEVVDDGSETVEVGALVGVATRNEETPPMRPILPDPAPYEPAPYVRTSWDEQHDLATHERQAAESQADLEAQTALKALQDEQYLTGNHG